jgi:hypothetical protein
VDVLVDPSPPIEGPSLKTAGSPLMILHDC